MRAPIQLRTSTRKKYVKNLEAMEKREKAAKDSVAAAAKLLADLDLSALSEKDQKAVKDRLDQLSKDVAAPTGYSVGKDFRGQDALLKDLNDNALKLGAATGGVIVS